MVGAWCVSAQPPVVRGLGCCRRGREALAYTNHVRTYPTQPTHTPFTCAHISCPPTSTCKSYITDLVHGHGLDRLRLENAHAVELPAVDEHLPELHHVGEGGEQPAARRQVRGFLFLVVDGLLGVLLWLSWGVDCRMVRGRVLHAPHISFVSRSSSNEAWGERTHLGVVDELDVVGVGRGLVETVGIPLVHRGQPDVLRVYVCIYVCDETYACHTHTDEGPNAATAHTCICIR